VGRPRDRTRDREQEGITTAINDNSNRNPGFFFRLLAKLRFMIWDEAHGADSPGV
jgi:hypothetical protein